MKEIKLIKKLTDSKYLNLYLATYKTEKGEKNYELVTRKTTPDLVAEKRMPDAVRIIPYYYNKKGELMVVLIKEFRYAINQYVYSVPAGLIDAGEEPIISAKRELKEEIGAKVVNIELTEPCSYTSAGLTDESIVCFEAEVKLSGKQHLDEQEDIEILPVKFEELQNMLDPLPFCLQSRLQLRSFVYKNLLKLKR